MSRVSPSTARLPETLGKLNAASNAYLKTKAATDLFEKLGIQAAGGMAEELKAFPIDAEIGKVGADHQGREDRVLG